MNEIRYGGGGVARWRGMKGEFQRVEGKRGGIEQRAGVQVEGGNLLGRDTLVYQGLWNNMNII
jgi:hypothetical protein